MSLILTMQGQLEPIEIAEDFNQAASSLNEAAMHGKEFLIATTPEGERVLVNIRSIICAVEPESV